MVIPDDGLVGFPPDVPLEQINRPVVDGVREITQDPAFDAEIDNEETWEGPGQDAPAFAAGGEEL